MTKSKRQRLRSYRPEPLAKLDLRVELSEQEILADLLYPAVRRRTRRA